MALDPFAPDIGLDASKPVEGLDPFAPDPNAPGPLKKGWGVGVAGLKSSMAGAGALAARVINQPELEKAALAKVAEQNALAAESTMPLEQVEWSSPTSVAKQFAYLVAQAAPSILSAVGGGLVGRGLGALAGRYMAATVASAETAKRAGTYLGAAAPIMAMETGGIFPEALETKVESPVARSLVGGATATALDFLPIFAGEAYYKMLRATRARTGGWGAVAKEAAIAAPIFGLAEGVQETGQAAVERAAAGLPLTGPEARTDYAESFAGGLAPGLLLGGGLGALGGRAKTPAAIIAAPPAENVGVSGQVPTPPVVTPTRAEVPALSSVEQHAAATSAMSEALAQIQQIQTAHETAGARMVELETEAKLPSVADRRPLEEIKRERNALIKARRETKGKVDALEAQYAEAQRFAAALEPQIAASQPAIGPAIGPAIMAGLPVHETGTITPNLGSQIPKEGIVPAPAPAMTPKEPEISLDFFGGGYKAWVRMSDGKQHVLSNLNPDPAVAREEALRNLADPAFRQRWEEATPGVKLPVITPVAEPTPMTPAQAVAATQAHLQEQGLAPLPSVPKSRQKGRITEKPERTVITPAEDAIVGANAAGEQLYKRPDGSVYRMARGRPNFGGDLATVDNKPAMVVNPNAVGSIRDQMAAREPALRELVATRTGGSARYKNAVADATIKRLTLVAQNAKALAPEAQLDYIKGEFSKPIGSPAGKNLASRFPKGEVEQVIADIHAADFQ